jgi:mRNA-degrading endonuclease RelE of RelBE toxin-antitoxin system
MAYKVDTTPTFDREIKRLIKKYRLLDNELEHLIDSMEDNPHQGQPLGRDCYKIRIPIGGRGKSGGGRVITCVKIVQETVYLLSIYDKSEQSDILNKRLEQILKEIPV